MNNIWNTILKGKDKPVQEPAILETGMSLEQIPFMKFSELAKRDIALQIYSEILGCEVWLCSGEEMATQVREDDPGAITYTLEELRRLIELNPDPEGLRNIHITMSIFSGSRIIDIELKRDKET